MKLTKWLMVSVGLISMNIGGMSTQILAREINETVKVSYNVAGEFIEDTAYNVDSNSYAVSSSTYNNEPVLTMGNFQYTIVDNAITIVSYKGSEKEIIIPRMIDNMPVTVVGKSAFYGCDTIERIELPDTVTTIERTAFGNCKNLEYVNIPKGVTVIGENAFQNCVKLNNVVIPEGVTYLGGNAFSSCISLDHIIIPQSVTTISWNPFTGCTSLQDINVAEGNAYFKVSNGVLYNIDETVLIVYPAGKKDTVFQIPNKVTAVSARAFQGTDSLKNIIVPGNVQQIAHNAFVGCEALEAIDVDYNNSHYMSHNGVLYDKQQTALLSYPAGKQGTQFRVPASVKIIGGYALVDCMVLEYIEMADGVEDIGDFAFADCIKLRDIKLSNNLKSMGESVFLGDDELKEILIPSSVTNLSERTLLTHGNLLIRVFEGSYAHSYVVENRLRFELVDVEQINNFVLRFYETCMGRTPDQEGLNYWSNLLATSSLKGSDFAAQFIHSDEFTNKNLSNSDYINILYNVFFDRAADEGGMQYWLSYLEQGLTRDYVLAGFVNSPEFDTLCQSAGITRGNMLANNVLDQNPDKTKFIHRFYTKCMGRTPDSDGLTYWVQGIVNGQFTGRGVADFFVNAQEFADKNLSDSDFVSVMYTVFFDRAADEGGKSFWMQQLSSGKTRNDVFNGFVDSKEFMDICSAYGINHH